METLTFPLEVKRAGDAERGTFSGLASVFSELDQVGDIVMPGAFRRTIREAQAKGRMPLLLFGHDPREVVGRWITIAETDRGLEVKGKLLVDDVQRAKEVHALMREGAISGLSIGYRTKRASTDRATGVRRLEDIDLIEISVVPLPAADNARVSAVKSYRVEDIRTKADLEHLLRDHGISQRLSKFIASGWTSPKGDDHAEWLVQMRRRIDAFAGR